jgi:hypothetical protein
VWQSWTNHEILVLLIKRIETFFGRTVDEQALLKRPQALLDDFLNPIMDPRFNGQGKWLNAPMRRVLMSVIRWRPRDLVKLCTLAAQDAGKEKSDLIRTSNFTRIFDEYSQGRVQDTINEFRSELPDVKRLILKMKPNRRERTGKEGYVYTTDSLLKKIGNVQQSGAFRFAYGKEATAKELAAFMYKINFITARKEGPNGIVRKHFEENRYLSNEFADFGFDWEIHPAYRWALQPDDVHSIFRDTELTSDD